MRWKVSLTDGVRCCNLWTVQVPKLEEAKPEAGTMGSSKGGKGDRDDKEKKKDKKVRGSHHITTAERMIREDG